MHTPHEEHPSLHTAAGNVPLHQYRLGLAGQTWSILHTDTLLTSTDEAHFFRSLLPHRPYGVALWPAAIALAHEVAARADAVKGRRVLELGAGTGLPGIVAASFGGQVVQTDRHELAMAICERNGARNGVHTIEYRLADWTTWNDTTRYDWILGADMLYNTAMHPYLGHIFAANLALGGRVLLADPFRDVSFQFLEALEMQGWTIRVNTWRVGEEGTPRPIGLFELTPSHEASTSCPINT